MAAVEAILSARKALSCLLMVFGFGTWYMSLTRGHIFCHMCACSTAVGLVDGLNAAEPNEKCPLCRELPWSREGWTGKGALGISVRVFMGV